MTHCKTTDTFMWHNNHGNCGRDRDLTLCYILWIIHTSRPGKSCKMSSSGRFGDLKCPQNSVNPEKEDQTYLHQMWG